MAVTVDQLRMDDPEEDEGQGSTLLSMLPFEAGAPVESFKKGGKGLENVRLEDVYEKGIIN
jgi:hypothetical protein